MVLTTKVISKYDIIILINSNVFLSSNPLTEHFLILGCPNVSYVKIFGCCRTRVLTSFVVVSSLYYVGHPVIRFLVS